jgi:enoyl-CoA hydratase
MMCDIVVANEETRLALSEAKVGRAPAIGCWLYGMMPPKIALELLMTGNPISARRAHEIGFINHIVPAAEVLPKALSIAEDILACAPLVVTAARQSIYLASEMGRTAALRTAVHVYEPAYRSEDTLEGWQAFREKRKPVWKNR